MTLIKADLHYKKQPVLIPKHTHTWKALPLQFVGLLQFSSADSVMTVNLKAGLQQQHS